MYPRSKYQQTELAAQRIVNWSVTVGTILQANYESYTLYNESEFRWKSRVNELIEEHSTSIRKLLECVPMSVWTFHKHFAWPVFSSPIIYVA